MAIKNFTQFALSGVADSGDFLVGYKKDNSQELRYTAASILTASNYDFIINGINVGRGRNTSQDSNIVLGVDAGNNISSGGANIAIGARALSATTTSNHSIAVGQEALFSRNTDGYNIAIGSSALKSLTASNNNTAVGYNALQNLVHRGSQNTAIGYAALANIKGHGPGNNEIANYNTAVGHNTLFNLVSGTYNTACGPSSLTNLANGSYNTGLGFYAGGLGTSGSRNVYLGYYAGLGDDGRFNCTGLGYYAYTTGNNQVQLGDSTTTVTYYQIQQRSDIRDKVDVRDTTLGLDFIMALRPVDFKWDLRESYRTLPPAAPSPETTEEEKENYKLQIEQWAQANDINNIVHDGTYKRTRYHHGLIAQEVKQVLDEKSIDFGGYQDHAIKGGKDVKSIGYNELIAPLIKAIQELKKEFDEYKASHP
jgi:hypothetical protein